MTPRASLRDWFAPRVLGLHVFAILAIAVCVVMGLWQLGVYDERQDHERGEQNEVPTVPLTDIWAPGDFLTAHQNQRPVWITGEFRPAAEQFWATGKERDGIVGVWLVAPVMVEGSGLLVVRGWAESPADLPEVPTGEVTFEGVLMPSEDTMTGWNEEARTIGGVRVPTVLNLVDYDLWSGFALAQDAAVTGGLDVVPPPDKTVSWTAGGRNLGYGLQWWAFVAFALFMWWRLAREMVLGDER